MTPITYPVTPGIRRARRGEYCEAWVKDTTYARAHGCMITHGLRKVGGKFLCYRHQKPRRKP